MTQPVSGTVPEEMVQLADAFGISREEIETVYSIISLTPELEAKSVAINGNVLGTGVMRAAREYDHSIGEEGLTTIIVEAEGTQIAFLVPREQLAAALTVEIPDVPSTPGPQES